MNMSQIDTDENVLSETAAGQSDGESLKLVPVAESIRYRKRAQGAEKKLQALAEELSQTEARACEMAERLRNMEVEQELVRKLAVAGAKDLETAVLIARARIEGETKADLDGVIEQLKKEKRYLFGDSGVATAAKKTAGAKDRMQNSRTALERAAKKAATTGNRTDLQEYLRLRRSLI